MHHTRSMLLVFCLIWAGIAGCGGVSSSGSQPKSGTLAAGGAAGTGGSSAADETARKANLPAITLHLAGDSTVMTYAETTTQEGWGQELGQFFTDKLTINNQAIGGASIRSFQHGNRWTNIMSALKSGDYVMMQFGANDSGSVGGRHVDPADFAVALREMADQVHDKGATPIFVTPSAFYQWTNGIQDNARLAPYAAAMVTVGTEKKVLVDDLNARGVEHLNSIGQTAATELYFPVRGVPDKAHFLKPGSTKMAQIVAEELKRINSPLAAYLK